MYEMVSLETGNLIERLDKFLAHLWLTETWVYSTYTLQIPSESIKQGKLENWPTLDYFPQPAHMGWLKRTGALKAQVI